MSAILNTKGDFLQRVADALTAVEQELESMFDCRLSPAELAALHPQVEERLAQVVDLSVDSLMYLSPSEALELAHETNASAEQPIVLARKRALDDRAHRLFERATSLHSRCTSTWRRRLREGV